MANVGVAVLAVTVVEVMVVLVVVNDVCITLVEVVGLVIVVTLKWLFRTAIATLPATHVVTKSTVHKTNLFE